MPFDVITIPCLADNFAYLLHSQETDATLLIDVPKAKPIEQALEQRGWKLNQILLTHHHCDHTAEAEELRTRTGAKLLGAEADAHRLPPLDIMVNEGDGVALEGRTISVPGHTSGHVAFYFPKASVVFTGDSLMRGGCGRLFEGSAAQMWESLQKIVALPKNTTICSGHEYTLSNLKFALTIEPENNTLRRRLKQAENYTRRGVALPSPSLSLELETNPFLRAKNANVKSALGMDNANDMESFAEIRTRKDNF